MYHSSLFWYSIYIAIFVHLYFGDWCVFILFAENSYFILTYFLSKGFVFGFVQSAQFDPFLLFEVEFLATNLPCILNWIESSKDIELALKVHSCKVYLLIGHL